MGAVIVYVIVLTFVALRARVAREYEEFSVAKRILPLALVFGSITATYVGPGFSIGFVGKGFHSGFLFWIVGLAYAIQNISVGLLVAPKLRGLKGCYTLGDAMGQKYGRECQVLAGIISVGLCMLFSAVMLNAGKLVLHQMLGLPQTISAFLLAFVAATYTTFGGLRRASRPMCFISSCMPCCCRRCSYTFCCFTSREGRPLSISRRSAPRRRVSTR